MIEHLFPLNLSKGIGHTTALITDSVRHDVIRERAAGSKIGGQSAHVRLDSIDRSPEAVAKVQGTNESPSANAIQSQMSTRAMMLYSDWTIGTGRIVSGGMFNTPSASGFYVMLC